MSHPRDMTRRLPTSKDSPKKTDDRPRRTEKVASTPTGFFNRRVRLTGDSSFSIPLALVLLFPCLVVGLILTLFARSPDTDGLMKMPAGTPPSIRHVLLFQVSTVSPQTLTVDQKN